MTACTKKAAKFERERNVNDFSNRHYQSNSS